MAGRRKTRRTTQVDASSDREGAEHDQLEDGNADHTSPAPAPGQLHGDLDFTTLSVLLPGINLESPTGDAISTIYRFILNQHDELDAKDHELDSLRADLEKKEIETDQLIQDRESNEKELENSLENIQNEMKQVRQERDEFESSSNSLKSQLALLRSSQSSSSTELTTLQRALEDTEREKRDLLVIIDRMKDDSAQRDQELQSLRESLKTVRREQQGVETELRELRFSETSTKFRIETLTQQLTLAQDENVRLNNDLSARNEEFSKMRRDKQAEIVQLQASLDSITQTHSQVSASYRSLQSSNAAQASQLSQLSQKVQDLTGQLADQEAKYSSEAANLRRLIDMMEEREAQAKQLVAGIERDWAGLGEKAAAREQELRRELDEEQQRAESLERQLDDTRLVLEKINRGELPVPFGSGSERAISSFSDDSTHLVGFSPGLAMISRMQKSGKTFTEVYADYVRLQEELAKKNVEYDRMDRTLAEVLAQIEERAPVLAEQRKEFDRLQAESLNLASELTDALSQRDKLASRTQELSQKLAATDKENFLLQQQLVDLGHQVQALLREISRRDDPSIPDDDLLNTVNPDDVAEEAIRNRILLFKSIPSLQEQNQNLLRITRDLAARMDADDRDYKEALDREQQEAIQEAHNAIQLLQSKLLNQQKSHQATVQAYMRERDALKSLLARKEVLGSQSVSIEPSLGFDGIGMGGGGPSSLEQELQIIRGAFDAYKEEISVDVSKLKQELATSQQGTAQLSSSLAKANAKIEYLTERQKVVQEQANDQARQYDSLSERNRQLYDQYTRLLTTCTQTNEELATANGNADRLRNENSNLRAEKKILEDVQNRLSEENKTLAIERSRLSDLIGNIQKMHNDVEKFGENDKRRLETQVQALEAQVQDLRSQLSREQDTARQSALQKDLEARDMRLRIDRLSEDFSKARESLVAAETSQKHLQDRVTDLTKQLHVAEEKLAVYERRPSYAAPSGEGAGNGLSKEQQLESEVVELRGSLKIAEADLVAARAHVQQFQEISQASETALTTLTTTYDEYKSTTEAQILQYQSKVENLQRNLEAVRKDVADLSEKNAETQQVLERERAAFAADKKVLEDIIVERTNSEVDSRGSQLSYQNDIRSLEERVKAAEDRHSREVLAHAETIKSLDNIKQELNDIRLSARESSTIAETAQSSLRASEESWQRQKEVLDKELADLTVRCQDLTTQNKVLHQHLESVSTQAVRIRQVADSGATEITDGSESREAEGKLTELRSVVAYLRKEKDIVDLQLELSKQESARLRAQTEQLSKSLDETRLTLSMERERAADTLQQTAQHSEVIEKINQLNILRESNATLRAESEANSRKAKELERRLSLLSAELDPVKEDARTSKALVEEKDRQIARLEDENRQWKERNMQLLTKYDRIDPSDVQALRDEIDDLQIDIRKFEEAKAAHIKEMEEKDKLLESTSTTLADFRAKYQRLVQESRNRLGTLNGQVAKLNETISELRKEIAALSSERDLFKAQLESSTSNKDGQAMDADVSSLRQEKEAVEARLREEIRGLKEEHAGIVTKLLSEKDALLKEMESRASKMDDVPMERVSEDTWTLEKKVLENARDEAVAQAKSAEERAEKAAVETKNLRLQNDKFQARILENEKRRAAESERLEALATKHRQEQEDAIIAATTKLRAELQSSGGTEDQAARHSAELQALEDRLRAEHENNLKVTIEKIKAEMAATPQQGSEKDLEEQLKAATERGRMEMAAKLKLKDTLLSKTQNNLKQLEAKVQGWIEAGLVPSDGGISTTKAPSISVPVSASASSLNSTPAITAPAAASMSSKEQPPGLPRKPSIQAAAPAATGKLADAVTAMARGGAVRGRGMSRGLVRGGRGTGRGAAIVSVPVPIATATETGSETPSSGMSIMGAAAKRPREEAPAESAPALAKRLKPIEGTGKPVALKRDRVPGPAAGQSTTEPSQTT